VDAEYLLRLQRASFTYFLRETDPGTFEPGESTDEQVEIAVMIDVDERGAPRQAGRGRKSDRLRDVLKRAVALLMVQTVRGTAEDEQIGTAVVVVVAGHRGDRIRRQG